MNGDAWSSAGLAVRGVRVDYGRVPVLAAVDLSVRPGELVGLIGPNGAGKTTLLRLMSGLTAPDAGTVTLDGRSLAGLPLHRRARWVSYLAQDRSCHWPLTVERVVALGRLPHRAGTCSGEASAYVRSSRVRVPSFVPPQGSLRARIAGCVRVQAGHLATDKPDYGQADQQAIERAIDICGLAFLRDRSVDTLSGGERARVLLARALAVEAAWLLADEPVSGMDAGHALATMEVLADVVRTRGDGVVVVMHDLTLAARTCPRVVLLAAGRVIADGPPDTVLTPERLGAVYGVGFQIGAIGGRPVIVPDTGGRGLVSFPNKCIK